MTVPVPSRWRQVLAVGFVSLPTVSSAAEPPVSPRTMEVLHGTRKMWPAPPAARPVPTPAALPVAPPPRVVANPAPADTASSERATRPGESQTIILTGFAYPPPNYGTQSAPWLTPAPVPAPTAAPAPAQPTVVVVREPAPEPRPAAPAVPEAARGVTIGNEALCGIAVGAAGLGFGYAGRVRRRVITPVPTAALVPPAPPPGGVMLLGEYNAGPLPATAEKFDVGPSYQSEQQEKKKTEENQQAAALAFILSQNLALHADPDAPPDDELYIDSPRLDD